MEYWSKTMEIKKNPIKTIVNGYYFFVTTIDLVALWNPESHGLTVF